MTDQVVNTTILDGPTRVIVSCTSESDGTGESDAVKVDLSALSSYPDGRAPTALIVDEIDYQVSGYNYVVLEYDRGTDSEIAVLSGQGSFAFPGGKKDTGTGGTGDIVLTTDGHADGAGYTITIAARKKYA